MAVEATSSATSTSSSSSSSSATYTNPFANASANSDAADASMDYNSFLQLLIAQLQNQDPTDPMSATEQVSQLATYSQVEQSIKTNTLLRSMLQAEALTRAGDIVGKTVTSSDGETTGVVSNVKVADDAVTLTTSSGGTVELQTGVNFSSGS
ncbi:flagellar hook assembly protein FlgD [Agrobacterium vitis]|uniref:Basal-body rod modification protein FlgD n=1 Tax=Agrobacterium vitis TaxID=373 RepID=A0ABD6GG93_AGRVI|nr:flagellar hook assembly protein FlgD [Agrobacterium vitis]MUO81890.1 flagellar hook assembly protein FlgD [Agrobacterium vitis]MUO97710.1 flagellar hook assembly protein FlgD [Agrobacterium vitis]MUP07941.1 flagellar hook assembly protein FlgD [Agrobacterium vitis]MUZ85275.1 flagellar hook assembly protein FlgD [Agrobacterium vitis]MVA12639.1 flagellar hook assembly protein FlgD [Agrobacterium vitis]